MTSRIAIIGAGRVGSVAAYTMLLNQVASEIILIDIENDRRDGQVLDLSDAAYRMSNGTSVRAGTLAEAGQCDMVVLTATAQHRLGEHVPGIGERDG